MVFILQRHPEISQSGISELVTSRAQSKFLWIKVSFCEGFFALEPEGAYIGKASDSRYNHSHTVKRRLPLASYRTLHYDAMQ